MKKKLVLFLCVLFCILLCACKEQTQAGEMYVYHLNTNGNGLLQETHPKTDVEGALKALEGYSVLPKGVKVQGFKLNKDYLSVYFNSEYAQMKKNTEVLVRAAVVQTLVQVEQVSFVEFFVDGQVLTDSKGNVVGLMRAEDFVQNTGSSFDSYQTTDLLLYFASKDGKQLRARKKTEVTYHVNTPIERLVVEQLIKEKSTIPETTKILGVSVREGICYVNLDSKFISDSYDLSPEVVIYSIVNSVIENGSVTKVQILVDGANDVVYKNTIDLSRPLEWNVGLLEVK